MSHHARSRLQLGLPNLSALALYPRRTHAGARFFFQGAGKIDDRAAGIAGSFPVVAGTLRIGRKESEVYAGELLGAHALDKVDLVARRFEPANRLVIVKQADIHGGEVSFIKHFGDFLAFERGGAHDGRAVELPPPGSWKATARRV